LDLGSLLNAINQPEADPFDALCSILFSIPPRTRRDRASRARQELDRTFQDYRTEARKILNILLENYAAHGLEELTLPAALATPALATYGNLPEIAMLFGGAEKLRTAVTQLQALLYAA
jgi:type I restriction enzyme R subunit